MDINTVLSTIPVGLRKPLIEEYNSIVQHYLERRWSGAELSGGRFSEIVYTIIDGYGKAAYQSSPSKPSNMVQACKVLENVTSVPRSFQILIPRMLPVLYEIRNNRNIGHVGGGIDPNLMDAQVVISMASWIMGELVRVFHTTTPANAQKIIDALTNRKIPSVWETDKVKRVLDTTISIKDQILLLLSSSPSKITTSELFLWVGNENKVYFLKLLRQLHKGRMVEFSNDEKEVEILPPGTIRVESLLVKLSKNI